MQTLGKKKIEESIPKVEKVDLVTLTHVTSDEYLGIFAKDPSIGSLIWSVGNRVKFSDQDRVPSPHTAELSISSTTIGGIKKEIDHYLSLN